MKCRFYSVYDYFTETCDNARFALHNHDEYEIYLFLEGDSTYVVEEKNYTLSPGDIIIIRKHEMHRVFHNSSTEYRRIVIMVSPTFFLNFGCSEYEDIFLEKNFGRGHKISADFVRSSGLFDAISRLKKYTDNLTVPDSPVAYSTLTEILYLINKFSHFQTADISNPLMKNVITYINDNFTGKISLDDLAERFFVSKYHLCHVFKQSTGLTVQNYIREKRLTNVHELKSKGLTLTDAAIASGFNDYSAFYRSYVKKYEKNPRNTFV